MKKNTKDWRKLGFGRIGRAQETKFRAELQRSFPATISITIIMTTKYHEVPWGLGSYTFSKQNTTESYIKTTPFFPKNIIYNTKFKSLQNHVVLIYLSLVYRCHYVFCVFNLLNNNIFLFQVK